MSPSRHSHLPIICLLVGALLLTGCAARERVQPVLPTAVASPAGPQVTSEPTSQPTPVPVSMLPAAPFVPGPQPSATPTVPETDMLPASLYFLTEQGQIRRLERDGLNLRQITGDREAVSGFDVSSQDGTIVFAGSDGLVRTNALGGQRTLLLAPAPGMTISAPHVSPDGSQVAFAHGGVYSLPLAGGEPELLIADTDDNYAPIAWSPDGRLLLLRHGSPRGVEELWVLDPASGELVPLGIGCCQPAWSPDSTAVFVSGPAFGLGSTPGLRRVNASSGEVTALIRSTDPKRLRLVAHAYPLKDGELLSFGLDTTTAEYRRSQGRLGFSMQRLVGDGMAQPEILREDAYQVQDVLWAPDGSGAVIADDGAAHGARLPLRWLPSDGGQAVELPASWVEGSGHRLRWGP